ncbi:MAG: glycerol-3-phosphate dehydrogenase, partial [Clostridia bacterium]|nr:glycerol-3-phosphate dehydrogenase [Clostridia bacterium]
MKVSVLGCGRWGSCIAWYLDKTGHEVLSCGLPDAPEFITLRDTRKNDYLEFPESIEISSDLGYAIDRAE